MTRVLFQLNSGGKQYSKMENDPPYAMNSNNAALQLYPWPYTLRVNNTLRVVGIGGDVYGAPTDTYVVSFTVVDSSPKNQPTKWSSGSGWGPHRRTREQQQSSSVDSDTSTDEEDELEFKDFQTDVDAFRARFAEELQSADANIGSESIYWMFGYVLGYRMALKEGKEAGYVQGLELGKKAIMNDYDLGYMYGQDDPVARRKLLDEAMDRYQRHLNNGNGNGNGDDNASNSNGNGNAPMIRNCPLPFLTPEYPECVVILDPSNGRERMRNLEHVANWRRQLVPSNSFYSPQNSTGGGLTDVITPKGVDNGMDFKNLVKDMIHDACDIPTVQFQIWQSCIDVEL